MPERPVDSQSLARTRQNQIAARVLLRARQATGLSQGRFLAAIGERLATRPYAQNALSAWEAGERSVPAAVLLAAVEIARRHGLDLADVITDETEEIPKMVSYLWVTARMSVPRAASSDQRLAFTSSILGAYNSRFKKASEVIWSRDGMSAVVNMAAGGYDAAEIKESVKDMVKRHVAKGAAIAPEHEVTVSIIHTSRL